MATHFPLQTLLDHARHRMEAAERLLRMLKHKEEAARRRMEDLLEYQADYRARLNGGGQSMGIALIRDFYAFMAKLDQAIAHQRGELDAATVRWQAAHDQWLAQRHKVKAYETLAMRHARQENQRNEKREQRQTDECALRLHIYPNDTSSG